MNGCLKVLTMHKIARIILDVAAIGWIALIAIALIMSLSSCGSSYQCPSYASIECQNCDEVD